MAKRATKSSTAPKPTTGQYAIQAVDVDTLRVDLYGQCIPVATGEPTAGWGCAFLTYEQAIGLAKVLTNGALLVKPGHESPKKRSATRSTSRSKGDGSK